MGMPINPRTNNSPRKPLGKYPVAGKVIPSDDDTVILAIWEKTQEQLQWLEQIIANMQTTLLLKQPDNTDNKPNAALMPTRPSEISSAEQTEPEHTINILKTSRENLLSARFRLQDVNTAVEMTFRSKQDLLN